MKLGSTGSSFAKVKETPNTVVYGEENEATPNLIGKVYVQRWVIAAMGNPDRIGIMVIPLGDNVPPDDPNVAAKVMGLVMKEGLAAE